MWICVPGKSEIYFCDMEQPISTRKSSELSKNNPTAPGKSGVVLDLEFPDGAHFDSKTYPCDPDRFIAFCAQWLPAVMARPGFWERRKADVCPAEFDLADPSRVPVSYPAQFIDELLHRP